MAGMDGGVLIVDDDTAVADAIRDAVRLTGYTVCGVAATAADGLEIARRERPRLAVIDVNLGEDGGTGVDLARALLEIGPMGIMFVTGYPERVHDAAVGHAWMTKPYRVLDLINGLMVVQALSLSRPVTVPIPPEVHLLVPETRLDAH